MKKETIRNLIRWMAQRHDIELDRIRVGSNQKRRYGSAHWRWYFDGREEFSISISNYTTDIEGEDGWNTHRKINILGTIVHEFAHLTLYSSGVRNACHGSAFRKEMHKLIVEDWSALVAMYNLLEGDSLSDDFELLKSKTVDRSFDPSVLDSFCVSPEEI